MVIVVLVVRKSYFLCADVLRTADKENMAWEERRPTPGVPACSIRAPEWYWVSGQQELY